MPSELSIDVWPGRRAIYLLRYLPGIQIKKLVPYSNLVIFYVRLRRTTSSISNIFWTDGKFRTDRRTENFRTDGRTEKFRTDGRKIFGRTEKIRTDGRTEKFRTDGRMDGRKKKSKNSKCVSNDRSRRDDSESGRIIKIGAILKG